MEPVVARLVDAFDGIDPLPLRRLLPRFRQGHPRARRAAVVGGEIACDLLLVLGGQLELLGVDPEGVGGVGEPGASSGEEDDQQGPYPDFPIQTSVNRSTDTSHRSSPGEHHSLSGEERRRGIASDAHAARQQPLHRQTYDGPGAMTTGDKRNVACEKGGARQGADLQAKMSRTTFPATSVRR